MKNKKSAAPAHKHDEIFQKAVALHRSGRLNEARGLYKKLLSLLPDNAALLTNLGTIALQKNHPEEAVKIIGRSLQIDPFQSDALSHLGHAFKELKRWDEALASYERSITVNPTDAIVWFNHGNTLINLNRHAEALASYERAIVLNPKSSDLWLQRGNTLTNLNRYAEALASYEHAIVLNPNDAIVWFSHGNILTRINHLDEALASYNCAIAIDPNCPAIWCNRGNTLQELKRPDEALTSYEHAVALNPVLPEVWLSLGNTLRDLKHFNQALTSYDRAIALDPNSAGAWFNHGNALCDLDREDEALASYDRAINITPSYAAAWCNRGNALRDLKRWNEALVSYDQAISLAPDCAGTWLSRANTFCDIKHWDEAFASYDHATTLNPHYADAWFMKSLAKLMIGEYAEGWQLYEWRWKVEPMISLPKIYPQPLWLGEQALVNKTLLIYPEQGFGDFLQFVRYAALAEKQAARVILAVHPAMMALASTLKGQFTLVEEGQPTPDCDYCCPMMSLPLAFKTRIETIPAQIPYLFSDKKKQATWQQRLGKKSQLRIGLVCSGSVRPKNDHFRSVALKQFEPLFALPVELHSLQKELRPADSEFLASSGRIRDHQDVLDDFSDTAALIEEMDLVIAVDTSIAHLAGALGKQVWILLSDIAADRWLLDREDSPWYTTAILLRQPVLDDWDSVIDNVVNRLKNDWL